MTSQKSVALNVAAIAAYLVFIFIFMRVMRLVPGEWMKFAAAEVLSALAGLLLAVRLRARVASWVIATFFGYSLAMMIVHAKFGIQAAQGGPVHAVVLLAAAIGVVTTAFTSRAAI